MGDFMVNVLHVISDSNLGGAGTLLVSLTNKFDKEKFKIFVVCPKGARLTQMLDRNEVTIIEAEKMKPDCTFNWGSLGELVKIIKDNKIDIVHTHASLSGRVAGKLAGRKVIYTRHTHSDVSPKDMGKLKLAINKNMNMFLCDKVVAVSNFIARQLIEFGFPRDRIVTIHNGINVDQFKDIGTKEEFRKSHGFGDELILIQIARIEEVKGHKYLIEAISKLDKEKYNVKALILSTGSKKEEMQQLAKDLKVDDRVIFTGLVPDINEYIIMSDVLALPSLGEAFGLVLCEGMMYEKPCIASNVHGIPEVVTDGVNGLLVEPKDVDGIKTAIMKMYDNPDLREQMGKRGKEIVLENFTSEKMARKVEALYMSLLG